MPKYKVGETVKCLPVQPTGRNLDMGHGFVAGKSFAIKEITQTHTTDPIYWPKSGGGGIYEHELEENDWDG